MPREMPDRKGFVIKGFTAVTSMMGDEAALKAMQSNEDLTTSTYAKALALEESWTNSHPALGRAGPGRTLTVTQLLPASCCSASSTFGFPGPDWEKLIQ